MANNYSESALKMIAESSFCIQDGVYVYTKVSKEPEEGKHFFVCRDSDEITVVTRQENLALLEVLERNRDFYKLISLNVSLPFYSVGFLATVSDAFASNGMNILILSTFSKDYVLIRADLIENAANILRELGFKN